MTDDFRAALGLRLREERERLGLSQAEFGAIGGVRKLTQMHYERGRRSPSAEYLHRLQGRGVDSAYVLFGLRGTTALSEHGQVHDPVADCDCHRCALAFRDRYRAALAAITANR